MDDNGMINFYVKVNMDGYCAESEHPVERCINKNTLIENLGRRLWGKRQDGYSS